MKMNVNRRITKDTMEMLLSGDKPRQFRRTSLCVEAADPNYYSEERRVAQAVIYWRDQAANADHPFLKHLAARQAERGLAMIQLGQMSHSMPAVERLTIFIEQDQ